MPQAKLATHPVKEEAIILPGHPVVVKVAILLDPKGSSLNQKGQSQLSFFSSYKDRYLILVRALYQDWQFPPFCTNA